MAKKASTSDTNQQKPCTTPITKMVLRIKRPQNLTREAMESEDSDEEARPMSAKKPKSLSLRKKRMKNNKIIDAHKPKKPPTAFFYFLENFRKVYQAENPEVKSMRNIGKAGGEKWKTMTHEEKMQYYDIATEKRAQFEKAMAEYIRKKEAGEYPEPEDSNSEFDDE